MIGALTRELREGWGFHIYYLQTTPAPKRMNFAALTSHTLTIPATVGRMSKNLASSEALWLAE